MRPATRIKPDPALDVLEESARLTQAITDKLDEFVTDVTTVCYRQAQASECCPYCGGEPGHQHPKTAHG